MSVTLDHGYNEGLRFTSVTLLSPYGNSIVLGAGDQVGGSWSGTAISQLYSTVFDDEASTGIYSGTAPFAGAHQPSGSLSDFDNQSITGTWQLLITNKNGTGGTVDYTIMVDTDNSTADPVPNYGTSYSSSNTAFAGDDLTAVPITITAT